MLIKQFLEVTIVLWVVILCILVSTSCFQNWTKYLIPVVIYNTWCQEYIFTATSGGTEREGSYFLGSVVSYENEDGEQEIIDGQQRITSLFLLLRAIYTKLVVTPASERTAEANNFIGKIEPAIWRTNKLTGTVDYKNSLTQ